MPRRRSEEEIQIIINDYIQNKLTFIAIHTKYGACERAVKKWMKERNIDWSLNNVIPEHLLEAATKDHINGMLMKNVEVKYGFGNCVIYRHMKKNNIKYKNEHGRKHQVNKSYFKDIDTEHKAYWLGFIMADGCIAKATQSDKQPSRLLIQISSKDKFHLEVFNQDIESTYKIKEFIPKGTYSTNLMCSLVINSVEFVSHLMSHGISERKTGYEHIPSSIPEELVCHFIRGFLDGDGCTSLGRISIACPLKMAQQIATAICYPKYAIRNENRTTSDLVYLVYNSIKPKEVILYLYQNSTIHLERKFVSLNT